LGLWEWELESNGEPVYDGEEELTFSAMCSTIGIKPEFVEWGGFDAEVGACISMMGIGLD